MALRPVVLLARMRELISPAELTSVLGLCTPPIDPTSHEWAALTSALDAYHHADQAGLDLAAARRLIISAAVALTEQTQSFAPEEQAMAADAWRAKPWTTGAQA
ncbi:hypothetical protein [Frankia tisae]|uniref:hypothetical protein n=1 Tax=Frankia tisae TaxID=2950104 RepID=UPI0021BE5E05|nr:hypothetical protein [Frankia tisae]